MTGGERHATPPEDDADDEMFALISLRADPEIIIICNVKELWKLDDVVRGTRKAYLRGCVPEDGEVSVMLARPRGGDQ